LQNDISIENYGKLWFFLRKIGGDDEPSPRKVRDPEAKAKALAAKAAKAKVRQEKVAKAAEATRRCSSRRAAVDAKRKQVAVQAQEAATSDADDNMDNDGKAMAVDVMDPNGAGNIDNDGKAMAVDVMDPNGAGNIDNDGKAMAVDVMDPNSAGGPEFQQPEDNSMDSDGDDQPL
jgi:hypothetical protein